MKRRYIVLLAALTPVTAHAIPYHTNSAGFITLPFDIRGAVSDPEYAPEWIAYNTTVARYLPLIDSAATGAHLLTAVNESPGCVGTVGNVDSVNVYSVKYVSGWRLGTRDRLVGSFKPTAGTAPLKTAIKLWCGTPQGHGGTERRVP